MIDDTLSKLEQEIRQRSGVDGERERELLELLSVLKSEIHALEDVDEAKSLAGFTRVTTHEATRDQRDEQLLSLGTEGLRAAVERYEASHPRLSGVLNAICTNLSNMGI